MVYKLVYKLVFLKEQIKLLNFEIHGDFMKREFYLTDMIFFYIILSSIIPLCLLSLLCMAPI